MKNKTTEKLDFMYDVISKKFERQNTDFQTVINKGGFLFAFTATLFAAYFGYVFQTRVSIWNILGFVLFVVTLLALRQALRTRIFMDPPPLDEFFSKKVLKMDIGTIKGRTIASMSRSWKINNENIKNISYWIGISLWLLLATLVVIITMHIISYYQQPIQHVSHSKTIKIERYFKNPIRR